MKPISPISDKLSSPLVFFNVRWEGKETIAYQIKAILHRAVSDIFGNLDLEIIQVHLEHPKEERYGDYSTNIAMTLAKRLGKKPIDIANSIKSKVEEYIRNDQKISYKSYSKIQKDYILTVSDILEKVMVAGPGFINLTIRPEYLITLIYRLLESKNGVKSTYYKKEKNSLPLSGKRIIVEFAHPNTHKAFHIGHLRNIITGEAIARILEDQGAWVIRANYQGDVGLHIAKTIYALLHISPFNQEVSLAESVKEKAEFLGKAYAIGSKLFEEDQEGQEAIRDINFLIYASAQEFQKKKEVQPVITDYQKFVKGSMESFEKVYKLWVKTRQWSLDYFDHIYGRLSTSFDRLFFESECLSGVDIAYSLLKDGILKKDQGAIIFDGKPFGLDTRVFINNLGLPTYEAKELALAQLEFSEFGRIDQCIHVVGPEQTSFFKVTFKVEELIDKVKFKDKQFHYIYGWVRLKEGKMSSRLGQVVLGEWLLDEAKRRIQDILDQSSVQYTKEEKNNIAEVVAVAAVKYSMLRVGSRMDIAFDIEESVSLEGDSGPYLLYTYARCKSVLRKASQENTSEVASWSDSESHNFLDGKEVGELNSEEFSLLRSLYRFPEVVSEAARKLSSNLLCTYLFDLSQKFNLFYDKHSILKLDDKEQKTKNKEEQPMIYNLQTKTDFRLFLTRATSHILKHGLYLLGIETVEMM